MKLVEKLEAQHAHGFVCHCLRCIGQWQKMAKCPACSGVANRGGHRGRGLQPGPWHLRRSFPALWARFVTMLARGEELETCKAKIQKEGLLALAATCWSVEILKPTT